MQTLELRIAALEARLADVEGGYGQTLYKLHRNSVRTNIEVGRLADRLGVSRATEAEIDMALDDE